LFSSSLSNSATAELMEGPSSDTLSACWTKYVKIGLVVFFASGLVTFFALVDLAAGFAMEGFAAGLLYSLAIVLCFLWMSSFSSSLSNSSTGFESLSLPFLCFLWFLVAAMAAS
jgi:hypothetical protein